MWTAENLARYERKGLRYPSELTDAEWALGAPSNHGNSEARRIGLL